MFYCWWTKSCTTKDGDYPVIYKVFFIPAGAGFLNHQQYEILISFNSTQQRDFITQIGYLLATDPPGCNRHKMKCFFFGIPKPRHVTILTGDWNPGLGSPHSRIVGGFNPSCKICSSNWIISPIRHENKKQWKYLKPPPRLVTSIILCS